MVVPFKCTVCGYQGNLNIKDMTKQEVEDLLKSDRWGYNCPGMHTEVSGSRYEAWEINWDKMEDRPGMTDEEFLEKTKKLYAIVLDTDEIDKEYRIQSFMAPYCTAINIKTGEKKVFSFGVSPSGKRYYMARAD